MATNNTPAPDGNSKGFARQWIRYETFGITATMLGFIVDSVAIASLLLAIPLNSPISLNPYHALFIWCIAVFTYFCTLQIYRHKREPKLHGTFWGFLLFYVPGNASLLLLPPFVAILLLIWILAVMWPGWSVEAQAVFGVFVMIVAVMTFMAFVVAGGAIQTANRNARLDFTVANDWQYWDKLITTRLKGQAWIGTSSLTDIYIQYLADESQLHKLLARYSSLHADTTNYGMVYYRDSGKLVYNDPVLVNRKIFDKAKYSI